MRWRVRRLFGLNRGGLVAAALLVPMAAAYANPSLAPWGWHGRIGRFDVYAQTSPDPALAGELAHAERLLAASSVDDPSIHPRLYLTDGGWRWRLYAGANARAFGSTSLLFGGSFINRSDIAHDAVFARGYRRTLSGIVAHEVTHVLVQHRIGLAATAQMPAWIREGFADHVAQESTLDDAAVAQLRAQGRDDPAIFYHDARKRVERLLAEGVSVDALFAGKMS